MNKPSISAVLTKVDTLHEAVTSLAGTVDTLAGTVDTLAGTVDTLAGTVDTLAGTVNTLTDRFDTLRDEVTIGFHAVDVRIGNVERRLDEHGVALLELSTVIAEHSVMHRHHHAALGRIERRQRGETGTLDDHERRITVLEQRPYPTTPAL